MNPTPRKPLVSAHFATTLAVLIALAHVVWAVTATAGKCVAFDEIAHVVAGQTYWRHGDIRLHPENGILPQRLAALPTLLIPWRLPPDDDPAWKNSDVWRLANATFYELGNDTDFALLLARSAVSLHAFGIALLVFIWSRRLFGLAGGFTSLVLCVLCPTLLAHGPLATSDVAMAFWMLAATGAYWRFLHAPSWRSGLLAGVCLGFAAVAKFSAPLLAPIWIVLWALRSARPMPLTWKNAHIPRSTQRTLALLGASVGQVLLAIAIVWTFYGWRSSPFGASLPAGDYYRPWIDVIRNLGDKAAVFTWLRDLNLLPDPYLYGLGNVVAYSQARGAFFNGEVSITGWVLFFPYAFLVKTPPPMLIALGASVFLVACDKRALTATSNKRGASVSLWWALTPLVVLLVVYWTVSLLSHLNIGHRHLLPVYPPTFVLAGAIGKYCWQRGAPGRIALLALLTWSAIVSLVIRPHYLAYFNAFAGGPAKAYHHLVESSLDWGLDLPELSHWLRTNVRPGELVHLSYFGMGNPEYEGIKARPLPSLPIQQLPRPSVLQPGVYAISATMLQQQYSQYSGPWTTEREKLYQELRGLETYAQQWERAGVNRGQFEQAYFGDDGSVRLWAQYEVLRFARLCHYLRTREPDAHIGYSILIFRVTRAQLDSALNGSLSEWVRLIESERSPARALD